jgi:cytochrome P450
VIARQTTAITESTAYLLELIAERRRTPADNLLTKLIEAEQNGDRLNEEELLATVVLLFGAGHETAIGMIGNGMLALLENRGQFERLRAHPELVRSAVEEVLRWDAPIQMTQRVALEDIPIGGAVIPKGALIILMLASGNRDEEHLAGAEQFDLGRPASPHLSFGSGMHYCLGSPLARIEGEVTFTAITKRFPALRLAEGMRRRDTLVFRGIGSLPVEF